MTADRPPDTGASVRGGGPERPPPEVEIGIEVETPEWSRALAGCEAICRNAAIAALEQAGGFRDYDGPIEVGLLLADDETVRELNRTWRGQDKPTNVLSFPDGSDVPSGAPRMLGDIVLAYGTVAAEAEAQGKTLEHHLVHLVVHGMLHLLGYDHENDREAEEMEGLETEILAGFGIADPYEEAAVARRDAAPR